MGEAAIDAVMEEMHRIDRAMSPHKPESELSIINRDAAARAVPVSDEMARLIARAAHFSRALVGRVRHHLRGRRPALRLSPCASGRATPSSPWRAPRSAGSASSSTRRRGTVRFARPGMRIDLGGFAKGHAVDNAAVDPAARAASRHAMVSAGGDSRVIGDRRGRPWTIGVRDPRQAGQVVAMLPLEDVSISTSGDYERYFDAEGVRFHHLIDPSTGRSPSCIQSVTILADDGLTSEALSKIVFVMGVERGMALIESQPGVDAIVVDADGALHYSSGLLAAAPRSGNDEHALQNR